MSVEIEPFELSFQPPFTVEISRILKIKNPNKFPVAFKVKTTAPKQYCVRPNSGRVEPGQDVEVTVLLQAMKSEPAPGTKCRDKFLVQSVEITADKEFSSIASILESTDKSSMQERKIRVNWITEPGVSGSAAAVTPNRRSTLNETNETPDATRTFSSPGDETRGSDSPAPPPYHNNNKEEDVSSERDQSTISAATSAVTGTAAMTYEELKAKLANTEAKLSAYQEGGGLRQRIKNDSEKLPSAQEAAAAVRRGAEGVSVKIVALLCLLSFLLAYFFF